VEEEWRAAWAGVPATPPGIASARAGREGFERLAALAQQLDVARDEHAELAGWVSKQIARLREAVAAVTPDHALGDTFAACLAGARTVLERTEADRRAREQHHRDVADTERAIRAVEAGIRDLEQRLEEWRGRWADAVGGLEVGDPPPPDDALVIVDDIDGVLRAWDEAGSYHARVEAIDRDAAAFRSDVRDLAQRLGEEVEADAEGEWVDALQRRLRTVLQGEQARRDALELGERLGAELRTAGEAVTSARAALAAVRDEARCGPDDDLPLAEQRSDELRKGRDDLERAERELVRSGDGLGIEALEAEAEGVEADALDGRLAALGDELGDVDHQLAAAHDARAAARAALAGLAGPSVASDCAEHTQSTTARLREEVLAYARLRLASAILDRQIEAYRREHQAPLLLAAGARFRAMTGGAFERLEADVEEDRPVLVGVRPDGARVAAAGMSEGTVDQVFLALRLAAVEAACAAGEPMPLVVDDILVQFDDDRTAAALEVLADVARTTQVVLFTHHRQVRATAEALDAPAGVFIHEL
jgi:uncharacterized protein YhaN